MDHSTMSEYMAHGFCFMWDPRLVWLHVVSDILTGVAYISIPLAMGYFIFKRRDLPFPHLFGIFALFIFSCGVTHLFAAYTVYVPSYWEEGYVKAFTALVSIIAAVMLIPMIPRALGLPSLPNALENIKRLNSELERQLEELRIKDYALASSVNGIVISDLYGNLTYVNDAFLNMWGHAGKNAVLGKPFSGFWQSETEAFGVVEAVRKSGRWTGELFAKKKDGTLFPVFFNANTVVTSAGAPIHYMASFTDMTDQKRSEQALLESEDRFRRAIEASPFPVMIHAEDGKVLTLNRVWTELTGYSRWDIPTISDWTARACGAGKDQEREAIERLHGLERYGDEGDYIVTCKDGSQRIWVMSSSSLGLMADGKRAVISMAIDVTAHRKVENQLRQSQKMESIGTLAGGVAHDFNNILSAIIGYGHITLMKMGKDDPVRLNIEHMLEAADRAAHLTKDLLLFSRNQISDRKPVDLNEVVRKVEKFLARVIGEDIECKTMLHDRPLLVLADAHQLEQVLMNFATNARDAMLTGGVFSVTVEHVRLDDEFISVHGYGRPGAYALISVSDTGTGMNEETRRRIFEPFFTTKEVGKGTGLGLAVVYGIIKQHEGYINVYSEPGKGTTFRIYLPETSRGISEDKQAPEEAPPARGTETILLAEDDESVRKLVQAVLEDFGYTVITAVDGEDAVSKFLESMDKIQLLLFDLIMPKKTGKEAYDEIRRIKPGIKILFSSGYAPDIIRQRALVDDQVTVAYKPVLPADLLKKVRSALEGGKN